MIHGIGMDIVEISKVRHHSKNAYFLNKVFTENEISYAKRKKNPAVHLATAFAGKEAVFKAAGTGWIDGKEVEIVRSKKGMPRAVLGKKMKSKLKGKKVLVSLSRSETHAAAFAVIFS